MQNAVPKHYLWAVGEGIKACRPGELIAGRYLLTKRDRIVVDTEPEHLPEMPEEVPTNALPYLRLFTYRLHIPQVYGMIPRATSKLSTDLWLLENGPIARSGETLMPELAEAWKNASALRQLHWLWQIAQLWQPCNAQGIVATLLAPELLRVEGPIVRLLELQTDRKSPSLSQLGKLWQQWLPQAHPTTSNFLRQLCQQMTEGQVRTSEQLLGQLDKALALCGRTYKRTIHIATGTDTGPMRSHNEDACYPASGSTLTVSPGPDACAMVCDGIGGQEGGEVASELAISVLRERIQQMPLHPANWDSLSLTAKLERATCVANDAISGRNDTEQRQGRQRMGTTLVMALAHAHELYITHIGDSRAYLITRNGCYQITLDDDVATREVRLGYALYRDALQQVAAGALVQALGITSSNTLHPTVQRFPIDEDCIFLLCSDGLSDKDRVEECWETEILPVLTGRTDLAKARNRLIEIANTKNGHDNVTVALVHCQVSLREDSGPPTELSIAPLEVRADADDGGTTGADFDSTSSDSQLQTHFIPPPRTNPLPHLLGILLLLALAGVLGYVLFPSFSEVIDRQLEQFGATPTSEPTEESPSLEASPSPATSFEVGQLLEIRRPAPDNAVPETGLVLLTEFGNTLVKGHVLPGSRLEVVSRQSSAQQGTWLQLKVCSVPVATRSSAVKPQPNQTSSPAGPPLQKPAKPNRLNPSPSPSPTAETPGLLTPGTAGWVPETDALALASRAENGTQGCQRPE